MKVREKVVRDMMSGCYEALTDVTRVHEASGEEVISAILSMAKNTIISTREMGVDMTSIRGVVEAVLMECHSKSDRVQ